MTLCDLADARVLTLAQPWGAATAVPGPRGKTIENRSWQTPWRGPLFINAGLRWSRRGADDSRIQRLMGDGVLHPLNTGIVTVATLANIHPDLGCCRPWGETLMCDRCSAPRYPAELVPHIAQGHGWVRPCRCLDLPAPAGQRPKRQAAAMYHWVLRDRVALRQPVPCTGAQGLRVPPPEVIAAVAEAVRR